MKKFANCFLKIVSVIAISVDLAAIFWIATPTVLKSANSPAGFGFPFKNSVMADINVNYISESIEYPIHIFSGEPFVSSTGEPTMPNAFINLLFFIFLIELLFSAYVFLKKRKKANKVKFFAYLGMFAAFMMHVSANLRWDPDYYVFYYNVGNLNFISFFILLLMPALSFLLLCSGAEHSNSMFANIKKTLRSVAVSLGISLILPFSNFLFHYPFFNESDRFLFFTYGRGFPHPFLIKGRFIAGFFAADVAWIFILIFFFMLLLSAVENNG